MTTIPRKSVIDYSNYIAERTSDFMGREWVFQAINEWVAVPDAARYFIVTGEPGIGKTAIAARLTQLYNLAAVHFWIARQNEPVYFYLRVFAVNIAVDYRSFPTVVPPFNKDGIYQLSAVNSKNACAGGWSGNVLFSHGATPAVSSEPEGFTSVFGMGTGVSLPL